uniref:Glycosyltransferase n=1 Tax=Plagiochasma appendiculatum TaxID=157224 RepID=A0A7G4WF19_9MARC|nr:UDP-glycosyltransferase 4 [Plagiochasma appendiculatum]
MSENGARRPHMLMVTVPFPGHCAPFVQLLYQLRHHKDVTVTILGHAARLAEIAKLQERGDFKGLEVHFETVFGDPPPYPADPVFPLRAAVCSAHMEIEFQSVKKRLVQGKNSPGAPTSMIVDMFLWWTKDIADEMGVPWYPFYSTSAWFSLCAIDGPLLHERQLHPTHSEKRAERLDIPGIDFAYVCDVPHEVLEFDEFYANVSHRTLRATGILSNSAFELEGSAGTTKAIISLVERRKKSDPGKLLEDTKVITVGPMAQIPGFGELTFSGDDPSDSLKWLNTQADGSVLYIAFGSVGNVIADRIPQLALSLEESGVPFLWVLKAPPGKTIDQVLPEGFIERVGGRGFVETGWAAQTRILLHPATGGFLTHCGWNSTLESLCAGVPMITWPLSADQPMNARYVTDVKKVGVPVQDQIVSEYSEVSKEDIVKAVRRLMVSDEGKEIKRRSLELRKLLSHSVGEGGSSYKALRYFINDLLKV